MINDHDLTGYRCAYRNALLRSRGIGALYLVLVIVFAAKEDVMVSFLFVLGFLAIAVNLAANIETEWAYTLHQLEQSVMSIRQMTNDIDRFNATINALLVAQNANDE